MNKVIMLIGGAILLVINQLSAQINFTHTEPKPRKKFEIGVVYKDFDATALSFKKFKNPNEYYRFDIASKLSGQNQFFIGQFGMSFGKEKIIPITQKLSFYHGWNMNYNAQVAGNVGFGDVYIVQSLSIGHRLGVRYDINKRFYIGAELNPQIGVSRNNTTSSISNGVTHTSFSGLNTFKAIGTGAINFGVKF